MARRLDARDQQAKHVVEDLDLLVVQTLAVVEEKIGDLPQGFDPLRADEPPLTASSSSAMIE